MFVFSYQHYKELYPLRNFSALCADKKEKQMSKTTKESELIFDRKVCPIFTAHHKDLITLYGLEH
ncbi:MAG: hypothetical protein LBR09_02145 [Endomicrobium sp.]|nr:hypothetical protein [Endomicrobium sp.]